MACRNICRMCDRLITPEEITFTGGNLVIDIPAGSYGDGCKYCLLINRRLPDATTINAPVVITIGGGAVQYPLVNRCCRPILAKALRTRCKYSVQVQTTTDTGVFRVLGDVPCYSDNLRAINGDGTPVTPAAGA